MAAVAARQELSNHFFTKNMHLSIWRPEYQRYVYLFMQNRGKASAPYEESPHQQMGGEGNLLRCQARHGRHYVYKSRYTLFFIKLLAQINDRASLEVLVKRIRKRPSEYFDFPKVWADVSQEYFKVLIPFFFLFFLFSLFLVPTYPRLPTFSFPSRPPLYPSTSFFLSPKVIIFYLIYTAIVVLTI